MIDIIDSQSERAWSFSAETTNFKMKIHWPSLNIQFEAFNNIKNGTYVIFIPIELQVLMNEVNDRI